MSQLIELWNTTEVTAIANFLGIVPALFAALFSFLNWRSVRQQKNFNESLISVELHSGVAEPYILPGKIRRKNLTRAEVRGMIGEIPTHDNVRFGIAFLHGEAFYKLLEHVQSDQQRTNITIQCTEDEMNQFEI